MFNTKKVPTYLLMFLRALIWDCYWEYCSLRPRAPWTRQRYEKAGDRERGRHALCLWRFGLRTHSRCNRSWLFRSPSSSKRLRQRSLTPTKCVDGTGKSAARDARSYRDLSESTGCPRLHHWASQANVVVEYSFLWQISLTKIFPSCSPICSLSLILNSV